MQPDKARLRSLPARRKSANALFQGLCYAATALGLSALFLILGSLLYNGIGGLSLRVFTEITPGGDHRAYNEWHQLDHMPEQFPIPGVAHGQRWVCSPACAAT